MEIPPESRKPLPVLRIREDVPRKWYAAGVAFTFLSCLLLWLLLCLLEVVDRTFLPTPWQIFLTLTQVLSDPEYWGHIGNSVFRVFMGFFLAALLGIPLGILAGTFRFAEAVIIPLTEFVRYMPAAAFIPLIMVWVGIGESAKILVIFIGCFFQLILMVADDSRLINKELLYAAYTLGARRMQVIRKVIIPALMPKLFSTSRLIMGWAWTYVGCRRTGRRQQRTRLLDYESPAFFAHGHYFCRDSDHRVAGIDHRPRLCGDQQKIISLGLNER